MAANIHTYKIQGLTLDCTHNKFTGPLSLTHVQTQSVLYGWSVICMLAKIWWAFSLIKKKLKTWNSWIFSITNIMTTITVNVVNVVLITILKYGVSPNLSCEMKGTEYLSLTVSYKYCFLCRNNSSLKVTSMNNCNLNTFAASYLNTQGLNNSCLKSPASTLVDLTFQSRARRYFSWNQLRNLSL